MHNTVPMTSIQLAHAPPEKEKTIYKYEEKIESPPPAPAFEEKEEVIKRTEIIEGTPSQIGQISRSRPESPTRSVVSHASHHSHHSHHHPRTRSVSTHHAREVDEIEESATVAGPLTLLVPERKSDREIRREIANLEAERRALRLERDADERRALTLAVRDRDGYEVVERREVIEERPFREHEREVIRVEKDRKGRMALVRSTH